MCKTVRTIILCCLVFVFSSNALANAKPLYVGIFTGGDSRNSATGGWDNDSSYSVDREMVMWQGKNFAFEQTYMAADFESENLDIIVFQELELIWYYGRVPMVNLSFDSLNFCKKTMVQLAQELSNSDSTAYKQLVKWAEGVKRWLTLGGNKRFLLVAFLQEGNYSLCFNENDSSTRDFVDPTAYKQAFIKGRNIVESVLGGELSERVQWIFAPNNVSNITMPGFEEYYPGDNYVDWVGISSFNFGGYTSPNTGYTAPWGTFDNVTRPYLDRLRRMAPNKPLALLQFGSISFGGDKNEWIIDFIMKAIQYPKLYLIFYFNIVKPGELGFPPGFDWPIFWNDVYDARSEGYNVYLPQMRYYGWLQVINNADMIFSPIDMPSPGAFANANWDIQGQIAPISNQYDLFPEIRDKNGDLDGDGVSNWAELAAGLNPLDPGDVESSETNCADGIDNDANGRFDKDDTVACGDIPLSEGVPLEDQVRDGEYRFFSITVPTGSLKLEVTLTDLTTDVDLYLSNTIRPSPVEYDYKSAHPGNANEEISVMTPEPGIWHVLVKANGLGTYKITARIFYSVSPKIDKAQTGIACDFDGNGQDDLVLIISGYGIQAYMNNTGWFDLTNGLPVPKTVSCGDIDGDGKKDIVVLSNNRLYKFNPSYWRWHEFGDFQTAVKDLLTADVDDDGIDDIAILTEEGSIILRLSRLNNYEFITPPIVFDKILVANMNADNYDELIGISKSSNSIMYYSISDDSWYNILLPTGITKVPDIIKVGDVDSDGKSDLVGVWNEDFFSIQVRSGYTEEWTEIRNGNMAESMPVEVLLGDVDGDNKEDIICKWDEWEQVQIWLQRWEGWRFVLKSPPPLFMVVGNFDGDTGNRDDVALIWSNQLLIFYNEYQLSNVKLSTFSDVPPTHWAYDYIEMIRKMGIVTGCQLDDPDTPQNEAMYCPEAPVRRDEMAVMILRAMGVSPASVCTGSIFSDVNRETVGDGFCRYIEAFSTCGITSGCQTDNPDTPQNEAKYCPNNPVTREEMAVFIIRALNLTSAPTCTGNIFNDVNVEITGEGFCKYIEKFSELGITSGCASNPPCYCPFRPVTRAEMAVFLVRAFL